MKYYLIICLLLVGCASAPKADKNDQLLQLMRETNRRESEALEERLKAMRAKIDADEAERQKTIEELQRRSNKEFDAKIRRIFEK